MKRKSFFRERTPGEILKLDIAPVARQRGLVERISKLGEEQGVIVRAQIIPGRFFANAQDATEASRKCYKHGDLIALSQPTTQHEAYETNEIPLAIRARDLSRLSGMREEEINFIGYSFRPVQGRDRRKRVVPFVWLPEALRLFSYAELMTSYEDKEGVKRGIQTIPYADSLRVSREGAKVVCFVPSRTAKKPRYKIRLENVPVNGTTERRAVAWGIKSDFELSPEHSLWNIRYTGETEQEESDNFTFYPHDIAAYIATARDFWKQHNLTSMEMNQFALFSKQGAEFYRKLCNNVLIVDSAVKSKEKLRKLHLAEKSILLARAIGVFGHDAIAYWDPVRDGKFKDYEWKSG